MTIFRDDDTGESFIKPPPDATIEHRLNFTQWVAEAVWNSLSTLMEKIGELENQVYDLTKKVEDLQGELDDGRE